MNNIILSSDYKVLAVTMTANVIDANNIATEHGTIAGIQISVMQSSEHPPIGYVYKDNKFQPVLSTQELAVAFLTKHMDTFAQEKNYDNIINASLRAGYPGPFHDEGVKYAVWMDGCWLSCYDILNKVLSGTMEPPTEEELIALLPPKPTFP